MRMRTDVGVARQRGRKGRRPDVIEKDEWADHAPLRPRQHSADFEATEIAPSRIDEELNVGHGVISASRFRRSVAQGTRWARTQSVRQVSARVSVYCNGQNASPSVKRYFRRISAQLSRFK